MSSVINISSEDESDVEIVSSYQRKNFEYRRFIPRRCKKYRKKDCDPIRPIVTEYIPLKPPEKKVFWHRRGTKTKQNLNNEKNVSCTDNNIKPQRSSRKRSVTTDAGGNLNGAEPSIKKPKILYSVNTSLVGSSIAEDIDTDSETDTDGSTNKNDSNESTQHSDNSVNQRVVGNTNLDKDILAEVCTELYGINIDDNKEESTAERSVLYTTKMTPNGKNESNDYKFFYQSKSNNNSKNFKNSMLQKIYAAEDYRKQTKSSIDIGSVVGNNTVDEVADNDKNIKERTTNNDLEKMKRDYAERMSFLMSHFSEEQWNRYEVFRRSHFTKSSVKNIMQTISGSRIPDKVAIVMCGVTKVFIGQIMEAALDAMEKAGQSAPVTPSYLREALRVLYNNDNMPKGPLTRRTLNFNLR